MNEVVIKVIGNYSYQTSRCLGEGVYGKVYEGQQRQSKEKVAIKKIDLATFTNDKYLENAIFSQIYLLKRFNHPHIVKFKDVLSSKNSLYIITQYCQSGDLKEMIKKKRLNEEQAFEIMKQILSGFTQLVKEKIIHRDLKPANILINEKTFKIGDFGFAKYVDNFGSQMLKSCVGSPIYMAPQILERTQYTTKCDIWSIGVIFYEMIHGYPPWKARDEAELLKGIKNTPITQILRKSSLSPKGNEFLRRTLAYSQQQRIGWSELFESFTPKPEKTERMLQSADQKSSAITKQRTRVISANSATHLSPWSASQKNRGSPLTPIASGSNIPRVTSNINSYTSSGITTATETNNSNKKRNLFSGNSVGTSNFNSSNNNTDKNLPTNEKNEKKLTPFENILIWRKYIVQYHYYCLQLYLLSPLISTATGKSEILGKLLLTLSLLVKNRSTFCMSMIAIHAKGAKNSQQIAKKMQIQHQTYEMIYNDIILNLQKTGTYKVIRSEMVSSVGHSQVINQQRMEKLEAFIVTVVNQNAQSLAEQVRKRCKSMRQIRDKEGGLVEALEYMVDIMAMCVSKDRIKTLREISEEQRNQEEELKQYVSRVISKVDRLTSTI